MFTRRILAGFFVQHRLWLLILLFSASAGTFVLAIGSGSVHEPWPVLFRAARGLIYGQENDLVAMLLKLRVERAQAAFVTGAALALSGLLMQALLRNPLADPYVLGVSGGASVGALLAILFSALAWQISLAACVGALVISLLLYIVTHRDLRLTAASPILLLTGVIFSSACSAIITLILSLAPDANLRGMVFWMIGDLSEASGSAYAWFSLLVLTSLAASQARAINVISLHGDNAQTLGVSVAGLRKLLFFCAATLTASAVSIAGAIGFVGLIVPHACRFVFGYDHRLQIPIVVLVGGSFVVLADTLSRTVIAPIQLPVGVITALIGAPVFLWQLRHVNLR